MCGLVKKQNDIEIIQKLSYFSEPLEFLNRDLNRSQNFPLQQN